MLKLASSGWFTEIQLVVHVAPWYRITNVLAADSPSSGSRVTQCIWELQASLVPSQTIPWTFGLTLSHISACPLVSMFFFRDIIPDKSSSMCENSRLEQLTSLWDDLDLHPPSIEIWPTKSSLSYDRQVFENLQLKVANVLYIDFFLKPVTLLTQYPVS